LENQKITIDGIEYDFNNLSETVKLQLASLRATDMEIARQEAVLAMLKTARVAYAKAAKESL
jgi:hypothetical protein